MVTTFALKLAKLMWFMLLVCVGAVGIDPAKFISLETAQRFALWTEGNVNQENFDNLWVLAWIGCSLGFAIVGYQLTMIIIRKMRR